MSEVDGTLAYYCEDHCLPTGGGWQVAFRWDATDGLVHKVNPEHILCSTCGKEGIPRFGYAQIITRPPGSTIEAVQEPSDK